MIFWIVLSVLIVVAIAAVITSAAAYKRQQTIYAIKSQIRQIKIKIQEYNDVLCTLLRTDPSYELLIVFQQQIVSYHKKLVDLAPEDENFALQLQNETHNLESFKNNTRNTPASPALDSDTEIETANIHINTLTKFINTAYKKGKISQGKFKDLLHHLQKLKLDIEVESHCKQAKKYNEAGDRVLAQSHLKQAKEALRSSPIEFPEKAQRIRDISEDIKSVMLNGATESPKKTKDEKPPEVDPSLKKKF